MNTPRAARFRAPSRDAPPGDAPRECPACKAHEAPVRAYLQTVEGQIVKGMAMLLDETKALDAADAAKRITDY